MTASNIQSAGATILAQHVGGVMAKPFDLDTILATVTGCLEHPRDLAPAAA